MQTRRSRCVERVLVDPNNFREVVQQRMLPRYMFKARISCASRSSVKTEGKKKIPKRKLGSGLEGNLYLLGVDVGAHVMYIIDRRETSKLS